MGFEAFDVVRVPFPFTDRAATKNRPALVLSCAEFNAPSGHSVMAMITSADNPPWPQDCVLADLVAAGMIMILGFQLIGYGLAWVWWWLGRR